MRAHGTYSVKITDPLLFYAEAVPKNRERVDIRDINEQYLSEFLEALQASINQMSADGLRISYVSGKGRELSRYMASVLDEEWKQLRGWRSSLWGSPASLMMKSPRSLSICATRAPCWGDAAVREGYVQGAIARGLEAAGSNANGNMAGFMGMGMGMQSAGGFMGTASQTNLQQMQMQEQRRAAQAAQAGTAQRPQASSGNGFAAAATETEENSVKNAENRHRRPKKKSGSAVNAAPVTEEISALSAEQNGRKKGRYAAANAAMNRIWRVLCQNSASSAEILLGKKIAFKTA